MGASGLAETANHPARNVDKLLMNPVRKKSRFRQPKLSALLVLAMLVRGLVPDGYMPDTPGADGGTALKLCRSVAGGHAKRQQHPAGAQIKDGSSDPDHRSSCPFSVLLIGAPLPALLNLPTDAAPSLPVASLLAILLPPSRTRPVLPPRGPPETLF